MLAWRRDLHAHPELAFNELRTADLVARELAAMGIEVHCGLARTGVVGTLSCGAGRSIGLRADLDALPIAETNVFEHRSRYAGAMHACGHDGHTAMLLGAARYLAANRSFAGTVHFIFQPAEEGEGGGRAMVADGLFQRFPCDAVYGLHNWPGLPAGQFAINRGPMMAALDTFEITVHGKGTHAAMPERGVDPFVPAAQIVLGLQTIPSRTLSALDSAVISVTQVHAGDAWNVIPRTAVLRGTVRCFSAELREKIELTIHRMTRAIALAHDASANVSYQRRYPATVNSTAQTEVAIAAATAVVGSQRVQIGCVPSMASEDFSFMLQACPGAYIWLGADGAQPSCPLHSPSYDFNDDTLATGAAYWIALVQAALANPTRERA